MSITPNDATAPDQGFLVNNWAFNGAGSSQAAIIGDDQLVAKYPYMNILKGQDNLFNANRNGYEFDFADVTDCTGVPGKGINWNPASIFSDHAVVEYNTGAETVWFDPSYAHIYQAALHTIESWTLKMVFRMIRLQSPGTGLRNRNWFEEMPSAWI